MNTLTDHSGKGTYRSNPYLIKKEPVRVVVDIPKQVVYCPVCMESEKIDDRMFDKKETKDQVRIFREKHKQCLKT
jgi:hypothetical protein